ncbi:MAG TPA: hypothetical protein VH558_01850 [Pseudolabrys sp.]|jgi:hypothetical protein
MTRATAVLSLMFIFAGGTPHAQPAQPYAGMRIRPLKTLSDEEG